MGPTRKPKRPKKKASTRYRTQTREEVARALDGPLRRRPRHPRSQTLPGMKHVRHVALDSLCEQILDCRTDSNRAALEEMTLKTKALQVMTREMGTVYRHAGGELVRVPGGGEKLRVRLTKETGDADQTDLEPGETTGTVELAEKAMAELAVDDVH